MDLANKLFKGDRVIWIIYMFLCLISVVEVFSATSMLAYKHANHWSPIMRHTMFLLAGTVVALIIHNLPVKYLKAGVVFFPISIVMLALTLVLGAEVNDTQRWLSIAGVPFQPSELAKLGCLIFISLTLSSLKKYSEKQMFRIIVVGVVATCALIFTENLSTAALLFTVSYLMMFIGDISFKRLISLAGVIGILIALFFSILYFTPASAMDKMPKRLGTWQNRITNFSSEENVLDINTYRINDENYQVSHAKIAIARGGVFGKMPGHGQQRDFLPQAYSDFIYAIVIEEMGLLGGLFVLLLYIMLLFRVGVIARKCNSLFPKYLILGCGLLLVIQALINIAVAVSLFPVTGQPLPLMSRGGTSTVLTCVYFGIILSISRFTAHMGDEDQPVEPVEPLVADELINNNLNESTYAIE